MLYSQNPNPMSSRVSTNSLYTRAGHHFLNQYLVSGGNVAGLITILGGGFKY